MGAFISRRIPLPKVFDAQNILEGHKLRAHGVDLCDGRLLFFRGCNHFFLLLNILKARRSRQRPLFAVCPGTCLQPTLKQSLSLPSQKGIAAKQHLKI